MHLLPAILIIGALVVAITFFSITMLGWCNYGSNISSLPTARIPFADKFSGCSSIESYSVTFQYKAAKRAADGTHQTECVICLAAFDEDESVRRLHTCKHIFHTSCIDRWLCSHSGCPLCRSQIDQVASPSPSPNGTVASEENAQMIMVMVNS